MEDRLSTSKVRMIGQPGPQAVLGFWRQRRGWIGWQEAIGVETQAKIAVELEARQVWV